MSRRMHLLQAAMAIVLAMPGIVGAQAAGPKIGFVSFSKLMQQSPQAVVVRKAIDEEFGPRQRDLVTKQNELKERQAKLDKDGPVMGAEERRNAESKFRDDERDLARRASEFQEDANVRQNEEVSKLQRELLKEVQAFAKQNGYDLIIGDGVIYAAPSIDVTAQVMASLEASFKSKAAGKP